MMDMYANAGRIDQVVKIFENFVLPNNNADVLQYCLLMKAYGNCNLANMSELVLHTMLNDPNIGCTIDAFHAVMNAWSISTAPNAIQRANQVLQILKEHPKCKELQIKPNVVTYTTLLKCLLQAAARNKNYNINNNNSKDLGRYAEEIIVDMTNGYKTYGGNVQLKPNLITYGTALKVCMDVQDYDRVISILYHLQQQQMNDEMVVSIKFYSDILHYCTTPPTAVSAIQCERILNHMIQLSKVLQKPSLLPNERLYNRLIITWMNSKDKDACEQIWNIYQSLISNHHFDITDRIHSILVPYFSKPIDNKNSSDNISNNDGSSSYIHIDKADEILQQMEDQYYACPKKDVKKRPDYRHYVPVFMGHIYNNDCKKATKVLLRQTKMCMEVTDMKQKRSLSPIPPSFKHITTALINNGDLEKASLVIDKMQSYYDKNYILNSPCKRTYNALLYAYQQKRDDLPQSAEYIKKYEGRLLYMNMLDRRRRQHERSSSKN
jgi:hypothetical protein